MVINIWWQTQALLPLGWLLIVQIQFCASIITKSRWELSKHHCCFKMMHIKFFTELYMFWCTHKKNVCYEVRGGLIDRVIRRTISLPSQVCGSVDYMVIVCTSLLTSNLPGTHLWKIKVDTVVKKKQITIFVSLAKLWMISPWLTTNCIRIPVLLVEKRFVKNIDLPWFKTWYHNRKLV